MTAFAAGVAAPYPLWFLDCFYNLGGSGATAGLVLCMLIWHKSQQTKVLGKLELPCALFNINEPIIFGMPIIMNPYLALPFCTAPLVNFGLTVLVMKIGLVPYPTGAFINNFTGLGVTAALRTGSIRGFIWAACLLLLDAVIYYPFYRAYDNNAYKQELEREKELEEAE
jgi:PTS system cellobiose-specific IIC component